MPNRFWAFTRRQTIALFVAAVVIGVVGAILLERGDDGDSSGPLTVQRVDVGSRAARQALWVFGFRTVRFDLPLRHVDQVPLTGFGSVFGQRGRVYLYDPGTGRVGVLHAARNRLDLVGRVPGVVAEQSPFVPLVAPDQRALWLVPSPGTLQRFDLATRSSGAPISVDTGRSPTTTGVVASSGTVITATRDDAGIALARVDPASGVPTATTRLELDGSSTLDGLATDGTRVWVVAANTAYSFDATRLAAGRVLDLGDGPRAATRAAKGAVVVGTTLYVLTDNGAALAEVDVTTGRTTTVRRILPTTPRSFRTPASLVTDGERIYAMVQSSRRADDHRVRIVGYHPATRTHTKAVEVPSALFAGAAAVS